MIEMDKLVLNPKFDNLEAAEEFFSYENEVLLFDSYSNNFFKFIY